MSVGYGTAALGRSLSKRERVALVEAAYDAGIRWFDTAPLYGAGAAEDALGVALRDKDDVVVTTKVGIVPPSLIGVALRRPATGGRFAPADIRAQLDGSLRRLRRDVIDVVLLHEVDAVAAPAALDALREDQRVERIGVATHGATSERILATEPMDVVQLPARDVVDPHGARLVIHSVLAGRGTRIPARDLLVAAGAAHPGAILLVGSRNAEHIREAAAALG